MQIGKCKVGMTQKPFVIAELSGNHNGDINRGLSLIDAAADAGASAVKLQTFTPDTITIKSDRPEFSVKGGLWDGRTLYDLYEEAHTPWEWHKPLFDHARSRGIEILSSAFDESSVELLESLNAPAYKIASAELVDIPLIEVVARTGKPIIMSTGMAVMDEIEEAVDAARSAGAKDIVLLHCVASYPAMAEDMNLRSIPALAEKFGVISGLSDHTLGTIVATTSVALGATVIEKHFTLRRSDGGVDSAFSLEPSELVQLVDDVAIAHSALGVALNGPTKQERAARNTRRSLYSMRSIKAGELIGKTDIRSIRPGLGLPPKFFSILVGTRATCDIDKGVPLTESMFEQDS
jgi:pseudaminic acid synthase